MSGSRESGSDWPSADRHASVPSLAAFAEGALPANEMRSHRRACGWVRRMRGACGRLRRCRRLWSARRPLQYRPTALRAGLFARIGAEDTAGFRRDRWRRTGSCPCARSRPSKRRFLLSRRRQSISHYHPINPSRLTLPPLFPPSRAGVGRSRRRSSWRCWPASSSRLDRAVAARAP